MSFSDHFLFLNSLFSASKKKNKSLQRKLFDTEEAVAHLLKQLNQHLVIMTAKFPSDNETYNTAIIKVDYDNKLFYLDELIPDEGNEQIKKIGKILLRTRLDGAILTAECKMKQVGVENNIPHYIMHFPKSIRSTQRRESYRVNIPLSQRIQVNMQTESGAFIAGFLNDISFSGIAIRLETNQIFDLSAAEIIPFITLHLKETITFEMEIKRISKVLGNTIISGHLDEISPDHKQFIQKFICQLDRNKQKQKQKKDQQTT